jgi:hypothetical protein
MPGRSTRLDIQTSAQEIAGLRSAPASAWALESPPTDGFGDGGLFDLRTLQVIRLRHVSKSLTCQYPSSLLWEDSHESHLMRAMPKPLPAAAIEGSNLLLRGPTYIHRAWSVGLGDDPPLNPRFVGIS